MATRERALAPDLARGAMMLMIVVSNTAYHLYAASYGPTGWHPADGNALDRIAQFLMIVGLDLRVYPLFAFLFGYGMMQVYQRETGAGLPPRRAVALLRRRSLWLVLFGFVHAALFLAGDILGTYGLISLVLGWLFVRRTNRTILAAAVVACVLLVGLVGVTGAAFLGGAYDLNQVGYVDAYAAGEANPVAAAVTRLTTWSMLTLMGGSLGFAFHAALLLGFLAARHGVMEHPERHMRLLGWTAAIGIPIGWLGGLPTAAGHLELAAIPPAALVMAGPLYMFQVLTGLFGGLGYAALCALIAHWLPGQLRTSLPVAMVTAVGKRSLSTYIGCSMIFAPVLAAWGLGLGSHMSSFTMAMFAILVWLVAATLCLSLDRRGLRGPAEALLRRLVYGREPGGRVMRGHGTPGTRGT